MIVYNTTKYTIVFTIGNTRYIARRGQGVCSETYPEAARELSQKVHSLSEGWHDIPYLGR